MLDAHQFINKNGLGDWFVQFTPDGLMGRGAIWVVFRFPLHIWQDLKSTEFKPRLTVLE